MNISKHKIYIVFLWQLIIKYIIGIIIELSIYYCYNNF